MGLLPFALVVAAPCADFFDNRTSHTDAEENG